MARMVISPETLDQELDGDTVFLHLDSAGDFSLDDVGTRVWPRLVTHGDTETVVPQMLAADDVHEATLRRDLEQLLAELTAAGLITVEAQDM